MWDWESLREAPFQTESEIVMASGPERRIMASAPLPDGVAGATIVFVDVIVFVVVIVLDYVWLKPHPVKEIKFAWG